MQALGELHAYQRRIDGYESTAYHSDQGLRCAREEVEKLHRELEREQIFKKKYMTTRRKLQVWRAKHEKLHMAFQAAWHRLIAEASLIFVPDWPGRRRLRRCFSAGGAVAARPQRRALHI